MNASSLTALALLVVATPALAQNGLPMPPPGGMIVSPDGKIVISSDLCAKLVPPADAGVPSADYKPGVDADGKPVAPADLPGSAAPIHNFPIEIPLDLRKHVGKQEQGGAIFAFLHVRDGQAYFNGEALTPSENGAIIAACKTAKP